MKKKKTGEERVKIIPLGGLEQIGMNITAFETEESIIVVDCGLAFPEDDMLGVDLVIPDITYLQDNRDKVKGFVITHGHEDHIGSLPYVLKELNVPIYATRLTMAIIENKLKEHNLLNNVKRKVVTYGQYINLGDFRIEFIRTNHSIADSAALAIYTPAGIVVHTGDFKVDYTPVYGDTIDLARFGELGKKGVLALMCDSTNVLKPGFTESERTVGATFDSIFEENVQNRIIVATFASNVDRVQQIINSAKKQNRKVVIEGRSMVNIVNTAVELGYIQVPDMTMESGSTEQMVQYGKYVYCNCWSYQNRIIKIDTETDQVVEELKVGIQPTSLVMDKYNKIWTVTDGGYEGSPYGHEAPSLYCIDAATRKIEKQFKFKFGDWPSEVQLNGTRDTIYFINKAVWRLPVTADKFPVKPFLPYNNTLYYGLTINPVNSEVYIADAIDYVQNGVVLRYSPDGELLDEFYVGIIPGAFCWR